MIERNQVEYFIIDYLNRLFDFKYLLSNNTDLTKDLGLSSMELLQMIMDAETRFDIFIDPSLFQKKRKIWQVVDIVTNIIHNKHGI